MRSIGPVEGMLVLPPQQASPRSGESISDKEAEEELTYPEGGLRAWLVVLVSQLTLIACDRA